ncbi:hypothetical protein [Methylobacterium terricola]|nr:hypothetical protein [Methylobacterium terricola]
MLEDDGLALVQDLAHEAVGLGEVGAGRSDEIGDGLGTVKGPAGDSSPS